MNRSWFPTVFDDLFNSDWTPRAYSSSTTPAVNVKEDAKQYVMEIASPGIKKEFCRVYMDKDGNLCVAIENKMEHKEEDKKEHYLRREFSYANYQQTYTLPDDVNKESIAAKVENGILSITLPKTDPKEEVKACRAIEVG